MVAFKAWFVRHPEKVAFAATATALAAFLALATLRHPLPDADRLAGLASDASADTRREHTDLAPARPGDLVARALESYSTVLPVAPSHNWVGTELPPVAPPPPPPPPTEKPLIHSASCSAAASSEEIARITFALKTPEADGRLVALDGLRLERRVNDGPWSLVSVLKPDATSTDDAVPAPKAVVSYRVTPLTSDTEWIQLHKKGEGDPSPVATITAPTWFRATVLTSDPQTKTAFLTVERYVRGKGWTRRQQLHTVGSSATLNAVRDIALVLKDRRCAPQFVGGGLAGCKAVEEIRKATMREVVLDDGEGGTVTLRPNEPKTQDRLCKKHADDERLAADLLSKADALFAVDPAKAVSLYKELLEKCGETLNVAPHRERIEQRARK